MRRIHTGGLLVLSLLAVCWAQKSAPERQPAPSGVLRGTVIDRDEAAAGEIAIRVEDNHIYRLRYDKRTWAERDGHKIEIRDLKAGETVEIVSDRSSDAVLAYARHIRVMAEQARVPRRLHRLGRVYHSPFDDMFPRGDMVFSGNIARIDPGSILLRGGAKGTIRILLRDDTRFLCEGGELTAGDLKMNARVFVRAGKNLDGEIEAYQVVWGSILTPQR